MGIWILDLQIVCGFRIRFAATYMLELKTEVIVYLCLCMLVHGTVPFALSGSGSGDLPSSTQTSVRYLITGWMRGGWVVCNPRLPLLYHHGKDTAEFGFVWGVGGPGFNPKNCSRMWLRDSTVSCCVMELLLEKFELFNVLYNTYKLETK